MAKIFFISPVRLMTDDIRTEIEKYVKQLESQGHEVHFPIRDTNQDDPSGGFEICRTNLTAIKKADEVHVWYLPESSGIHFDLGATFMLTVILGLKKKIVFVNRPADVPKDESTRRKGFFNVLRALDDGKR